MRWIVPRASIAACGWMPPSGTATWSTRGACVGATPETTVTTARASSLIGIVSFILARCGRMPPMPDTISRRRLLATLGGAMCVRGVLAAQAQQGAPTVISNPPRDFGPNAPPTTYFNDPDVLTVDPAFNGLVQANASIVRLWAGALGAGGPAWNGQGRYLLWSDIPTNRQFRWLEDDGHVSVFRSPSNYSNGNTFDRDGRQLACEH